VTLGAVVVLGAGCAAGWLGEADGLDEAGGLDPDAGDDRAGDDEDDGWVVVTVVQAARPTTAADASVTAMIFMAHLPPDRRASAACQIRGIRPGLPDYLLSVIGQLLCVADGPVREGR